MTAIEHPEIAFDFVRRFSLGQISQPIAGDLDAAEIVHCLLFDWLKDDEAKALRADKIELADQERFEALYKRWLEAALAILTSRGFSAQHGPIAQKIAECQEVLREFANARDGEAIMDEFFEDESKPTTE